MEGSINFDLSILFRYGDLDPMRIIKKNPSLEVGDYFNLLSEAENVLPKCIEALTRIADYKVDADDLDNLEKTKDSMVEIGFRKLAPVLDEIIKARKEGRIDVAADQSKEVLERVKTFYARIKSANKPGADGGTDGDGTPFENYKVQLMKLILPQLEQEEANRKLRILAIDDAPTMIKTISSVLDEEYKVYGMTNPKMLEKFLGQITPDLFLLDYQMPDINGFELVPIIRKFEEHKDTPIIFLTSMGTMDHVSAAAKLGASDFIVKPFQPDNLRDKVSKHIVRKTLVI